MDNKSFEPIYSPRDSQELMLIHSKLIDTGIVYFIDNENYFASTGDMFGFADTRMTLMVASRYKERAISILKDILK